MRAAPARYAVASSAARVLRTSAEAEATAAAARAAKAAQRDDDGAAPEHWACTPNKTESHPFET